MPSAIKIIKIPPGFTPEKIRKEWVGVTIPLATRENYRQHPPSGIRIGDENIGGFEVAAEDAIKALQDAGKNRAAGFWKELFSPGDYFIFRKDVCELI